MAYGCTILADGGTCKYVHGFVFSRTHTLAQKYLNIACKLFERACVDLDIFKVTPQNEGKGFEIIKCVSEKIWLCIKHMKNHYALL